MGSDWKATPGLQIHILVLKALAPLLPEKRPWPAELPHGKPGPPQAVLAQTLWSCWSWLASRASAVMGEGRRGPRLVLSVAPSEGLLV